MRRFTLICLLFGGICASAACSLFVDTDGLQGGGSDGGTVFDAPATTDAPGADATGGDAGFDAGPPCVLSAPWGRPSALDSLNSTSDDTGIRLSRDELTAYFASNRNGTYELHTATRSSVTASFGALSILGVSDPSWNDFGPSLTADGLVLFFDSDRDGGAGGRDLYTATRTSADAGFAAVADVTELDTSANDARSYVLPTGLVVYFSHDTSNGYDIFRAERPSLTAPFGAPVSLDALNSAEDDSYPVVSDDEKTIYFASARMNASSGDADIFVATRAVTTDGFSAPTRVEELVDVDTTPGWISPDGCRLYFYKSITSRGYDLYVSAKPAL